MKGGYTDYTLRRKKRVIMQRYGATSDDLDLDICCQGHPPE